MNYIILDLEATCYDKNDLQSKSKQSEIIEIGAVKLNEKLEIISRFESFVKPKNDPVLSDFCKDLTRITQKDIDDADSFSEVIEDFKSWIGSNYILCSWGFYDKNQFIKDCVLHGLDYEWVERHISIKHQFMEMEIFKESSIYKKQVKKKRRPSAGMMTALNILGIEHKGIHHRGIDDAENIANIFVSIFKDLQFPITLNNRFDCVFENDYKGIFMEVNDNQTHVAFSFYNRFEIEGEVCLREKELDSLINLLQELKKNSFKIK